MMLKTKDLSNPQLVLIDLGVSKAMATLKGGTLCGTPGYIPPETWQQNKWFPKGDVFSLGVSMLQVLTCKVPPTGPRNKTTPGGIFIEGCTTLDDITQATKVRPPPLHLVPSMLPNLRRLCEELLRKQMKERPTPQVLLEDPLLGEARRPRIRPNLAVPGGQMPNMSGDRISNRGSYGSDDGGLGRKRGQTKMQPSHAFATMGITASMLRD